MNLQQLAGLCLLPMNSLAGALYTARIHPKKQMLTLGVQITSMDLLLSLAACYLPHLMGKTSTNKCADPLITAQ